MDGRDCRTVATQAAAGMREQTKPKISQSEQCHATRTGGLLEGAGERNDSEIETEKDYTENNETAGQSTQSQSHLI